MDTNKLKELSQKCNMVDLISENELIVIYRLVCTNENRKVRTGKSLFLDFKEKLNIKLAHYIRIIAFHKDSAIQTVINIPNTWMQFNCTNLNIENLNKIPHDIFKKMKLSNELTKILKMKFASKIKIILINLIEKTHVFFDKLLNNFKIPLSCLHLFSYTLLLELDKQFRRHTEKKEKIYKVVKTVKDCEIWLLNRYDLLKETKRKKITINNQFEKLFEEIDIERTKLNQIRSECDTLDKYISIQKNELDKLNQVFNTKFSSTEPFYLASKEALNALKFDATFELKTYIKPPKDIVDLMKVLCLMFNKSETLEEALSLLKDIHLKDKMIYYEKEKMSDKVYNSLQSQIKQKYLDYNYMRYVSLAASDICRWIHGTYKYAYIFRGTRQLKDNIHKYEILIVNQKKIMAIHRTEENKCIMVIQSNIKQQKCLKENAKKMADKIENLNEELEMSTTYRLNIEKVRDIFLSTEKLDKVSIGNIDEKISTETSQTGTLILFNKYLLECVNFAAGLSYINYFTDESIFSKYFLFVKDFILLNLTPNNNSVSTLKKSIQPQINGNDAIRKYALYSSIEKLNLLVSSEPVWWKCPHFFFISYAKIEKVNEIVKYTDKALPISIIYDPEYITKKIVAAYCNQKYKDFKYNIRETDYCSKTFFGDMDKFLQYNELDTFLIVHNTSASRFKDFSFDSDSFDSVNIRCKNKTYTIPKSKISIYLVYNRELKTIEMHSLFQKLFYIYNVNYINLKAETDYINSHLFTKIINLFSGELYNLHKSIIGDKLRTDLRIKKIKEEIINNIIKHSENLINDCKQNNVLAQHFVDYVRLLNMKQVLTSMENKKLKETTSNYKSVVKAASYIYQLVFKSKNYDFMFNYNTFLDEFDVVISECKSFYIQSTKMTQNQLYILHENINRRFAPYIYNYCIEMSTFTHEINPKIIEEHIFNLNCEQGDFKKKSKTDTIKSNKENCWICWKYLIDDEFNQTVRIKPCEHVINLLDSNLEIHQVNLNSITSFVLPDKINSLVCRLIYLKSILKNGEMYLQYIGQYYKNKMLLFNITNSEGAWILNFIDKNYKVPYIIYSDASKHEMCQKIIKRLAFNRGTSVKFVYLTEHQNCVKEIYLILEKEKQMNIWLFCICIDQKAISEISTQLLGKLSTSLSSASVKFKFGFISKYLINEDGKFVIL
ncbi:hypothetical protein A3Q56_00697 [Intoshia linei]|uniref:Dynein heavy chain coiled coil stalk domain-containing protein n=1 Tax=Intoshia linei TaxID=1819745 RepID=A0A177BBJ1_9BILA|nr:hypothetical protein A3Q56_00697 [Intoshia linei]